MIETITEYQFQDKMVKHGFSYDGSKALFNYLEQLEDDCNMKIEFDPIAIRCKYIEYNDLAELNNDYAPLYYENDYDMKSLAEITTVIEIDGLDSIIIQAF